MLHSTTSSFWGLQVPSLSNLSEACQRLDTLSFPPSSFWNNKDDNLFCMYKFIQISFSLLSLFVCLLLALFCIFIECNCSYFRPMPSLLNDWNWKSKRLWLKLCVSCIKPHYMDWSRYQRGRKLFLRKVLLLYHQTTCHYY